MSKRPKKARTRKPERTAPAPTSASASASAAPASTRRLVGARFRVLAILCLGGGIILLFLAGSEWYASYRLRTRGIATAGKIVGLERHINPGEAATLKATIRYETVAGKDQLPRAQEATLPISQATYDRWRSENAIQVRYLPDDPSRCSVEDSPPDLAQKLAVGGGAFLIGLVLSYLAFYRWPRKARAQAQALASGPAA